MTTSFHLEEFSSGMKAKLDIKHRRNQDQQFQINRSKTNFKLSNDKTILPFTTKTKAYGTYNWREKS